MTETERTPYWDARATRPVDPARERAYTQARLRQEEAKERMSPSVRRWAENWEAKKR